MCKRKFNISQFVCPECKNIIPLPRLNKKPRKNGHIKSIYCPWCNKTQEFTEYKYNQPITNQLQEDIYKED